jgi:hypothetical protein
VRSRWVRGALELDAVEVAGLIGELLATR